MPTKVSAALVVSYLHNYTTRHNTQILLAAKSKSSKSKHQVKSRTHRKTLYPEWNEEIPMWFDVASPEDLMGAHLILKFMVKRAHAGALRNMFRDLQRRLLTQQHPRRTTTGEVTTI